jgi:rhodanese-related sulfurtransferase
MSVPKPIGDPKILSRRIERSHRFDDVDSVVDSGSTVNTVQRARESEVSVKRNPNEHFRRLRPSTVVRSIMAGQETRERDGDDYGLPPPPPPLQMLLLDLREREAYDECRIQTAVHYPYAMINRSTNNLTAEMMAARNKANCLVVLYDLEEEIVCGRNIANVFFERGFDNVAIISGGLKAFASEASELLFGTPPFAVAPRKPSARRLPGGGHSEMDAASTRATSVATSHKPKSLASSLARRTDGPKGWR